MHIFICSSEDEVRGAKRMVLAPLPVDMKARWTGSEGVSMAPVVWHEKTGRLTGKSMEGAVTATVEVVVVVPLAVVVEVVVVTRGEGVGDVVLVVLV
jgi:hypothetical protein